MFFLGWAGCFVFPKLQYNMFIAQSIHSAINRFIMIYDPFNHFRLPEDNSHVPLCFTHARTLLFLTHMLFFSQDAYPKGVIPLAAIQMARAAKDNKFEVVTSHRTFVFRADNDGKHSVFIQSAFTLHSGYKLMHSLGIQTHNLF